MVLVIFNTKSYTKFTLRDYLCYSLVILSGKRYGRVCTVYIARNIHFGSLLQFSDFGCSFNRGCNSTVEATAAELEDVKTWLDVQRRLVSMLQNAATTCFIERDQSLNKHQRRKYFYSSKTLVSLRLL